MWWMRTVLAAMVTMAVTFSAYADTFPVDPSLIHKIGGQLVVNGMALTPDTDDGYRIEVTRPDGTALSPVAETTGVLASGKYVLYIPLYDSVRQPGGVPLQTAVALHVYHNGTQLLISEPTNGIFVLAEPAPGYTTQVVDIQSVMGPGGTSACSQEELDAAIAEAVAKWDVGGDGKIGLPEAIRALQIMAGITPP